MSTQNLFAPQSVPALHLEHTKRAQAKREFQIKNLVLLIADAKGRNESAEYVNELEEQLKKLRFRSGIDS